MAMTKLTATALCLWVANTAVQGAAFNAELQWNCRNMWTHTCDQFEAVNHRSRSVFFGALPISLIVAPAVTGFYQHGFTWKITPAFQRVER